MVQNGPLHSSLEWTPTRVSSVCSNLVGKDDTMICYPYLFVPLVGILFTIVAFYFSKMGTNYSMSVGDAFPNSASHCYGNGTWGCIYTFLARLKSS
jgi:hypothetical protein